MIDWESTTSHVLCNPRLSAAEQASAQKLLSHFPELKGHLWLATSGTTGMVKWTALSKKAVLASAAAVNTHLNISSQDCWINPLPSFHVGGLGIWARSYLNRARHIVFEEKWDPDRFHEVAMKEKATFSALVPAQLYDLVQKQLKPPVHLRKIIIGGGALPTALAEQAAALGWRLLPSYGMTECGSQVATATAENGPLYLLPHLEVKIEDEHICVRGASLLTGYAILHGENFIFKDPKQGGWFHSEDRGALHEKILHVHGRSANFVKIGGESVDLSRLEALLSAIALELSLKMDATLVAVPDERLGHVIHLATTTPPDIIHPLVNRFAERVLPFEKIRCIHFLSEIPRSPLGKVMTAELRKRLGQSCE